MNNKEYNVSRSRLVVEYCSVEAETEEEACTIAMEKGNWDTVDDVETDWDDIHATEVSV